MTGKQWLSSNYAVEGRWGKIRADSDKTAGAFVYDYMEPSGVWDAMDAVHNYATALRFVWPDNNSGHLLLKCLHDYRYFDGAGFPPARQKKLIMDFFDQVLSANAMRGRSKKPPVNREEMMATAKELLFKQGESVAESVNVTILIMQG